MKKQNIILLLIVVVLGAAALYYFKFYKENMGDDCGDDEVFTNYSIADTAAVTKVFLADKEGNSALLERKGKIWTINEKYTARQDATDILLKTLKRMEFKSPVSKASRDNIIRLLSGRSTKVEVYSGNTLLKTYYVGDATKDQFGTYMLMELDGQKACTPAIVHIPGFSGFLSSRFFTNENDWRDKNIFTYNFEDIKSVKIEDHSAPEKSYIAINNGNNNFDLQTIDGKSFAWFDTVGVKTFFGYYKKVNFESFLPGLSQEQKDSIVATKPFKTIYLTDIEGKETILKLFRRQNPGLLDFDGQPMEWDPDRLYAWNENLGLIVIQYYVFDPLTVSLDYFLKKPEA